MDFKPDLDAYFQRIDDTGSREPTLETLNRIIFAHVKTIPFENLDILLGQPISVEPPDIERKLVHNRRGGYCFEQNSLLYEVLLELGYAVQMLSARVRLQRPRSFTPPRTHLFLRVEIEGVSWLADVGVGALSPTCALQLTLDTPQQTPHETRRFVSAGQWQGFDQRAPDAVLFHQVLFGDNWEDVCEFTLEPMHPIDRELGNWFTSAHPESHFRHRLVVARADASGRVTLLNRVLTHRDAGGAAVSRTLDSDDAILQALRDDFGLNFADGTRFNCPGLDG
ncbi:MAG: arylamine N-acetyltransferase [Immundisolibacteraceae bacterium]|nr:arylamine N-acetyltransferase [Immundisolibacteraceae bacterium]